MNLRDRIVESPNSIGARARARRWEIFRDTFGDVSDYSVLDLGGTPSSWQRAPARPRSVTMLNLYAGQLDHRDEGEAVPEWIELVQGDACAPPDEITQRRFDLVFSNSLIEHVGGIYRRRQLAEVIGGCGDRYWVQTPYRYFPIEPHWIFPGFQFLPLSSRAWVTRSWPLHTRAETKSDAVETALNVELLSITEMQQLFADSTIKIERFGGLPKSLVAVRA